MLDWRNDIDNVNAYCNVVCVGRCADLLFGCDILMTVCRPNICWSDVGAAFCCFLPRWIALSGRGGVVLVWYFSVYIEREYLEIFLWNMPLFRSRFVISMSGVRKMRLVGPYIANPGRYSLGKRDYFFRGGMLLACCLTKTFSIAV